MRRDWDRVMKHLCYLNKLLTSFFTEVEPGSQKICFDFFNTCKYISGIEPYNKEYNQKLYHFSCFTKSDVNLVKLTFQNFILTMTFRM